MSGLWLALSSSSPVVSRAWMRGDQVIWAALGGAGHAPSTWLAEGLAQDQANGFQLDELTGIVADLGPGGFSAVKAGVTMVKTLAYALNLPVAGVSAFDLIDPERPVAIPRVKQEVYFRTPGQEPVLMPAAELPGDVLGYGASFAEPEYPLAQRAVALMDRLIWVSPAELVPEYLAAPSISQAKKPFIMGETFRPS
jgi:tRNA A37 threonylcarbamoyladenosine modification protein TsaB